MSPPTLIALLYAGLAGTLLALLVATWQNNWQPRVFFLLALRLAIGWHFLFEGLHKIHSHSIGETVTNRPFSSEPYFKVAPGPLGSHMRKQFSDTAAIIEAKVKPTQEIAPAAFAKLPAEEQAAACPPAVAQELESVSDPTATPALVTAAKAKYARWVYGVEGRETKVKFITGEPALTAPQRLAHLNWLRRELQTAEDQLNAGLGGGNGTEVRRIADLRTELITAEADLAADAEAFVAELKKGLGAKAAEEPAPRSRGQRMDVLTMWFITVVGACLLLGVLTPVACVAGAGFLALTYLTHPPFPWFPLPPNTEGNPLYINKNVIEAIALLTIAVHPTGRWLGLDALLARCCSRCCRRRSPSPAEAAEPTSDATESR